MGSSYSGVWESSQPKYAYNPARGTILCLYLYNHLNNLDCVR